MPWSRVDKDELLIAAKTRRQVEDEIRLFDEEFQRRHPIAWSEIAQVFYCWMDRRKTAAVQVPAAIRKEK